MESMEENKMTAEEEIENGAEEKNEETVTEEDEDQSSESMEEFAQRMLADDLKRYREHENEWSTSQLLATVLFMMAQNVPVSVPAKLEFGDDGDDKKTVL